MGMVANRNASAFVLSGALVGQRFIVNDDGSRQREINLSKGIFMKNWLVLLALLPTTSIFAAERMILSKTSSWGFGPPESRRIEACEIYADRVMINLTMGSAKIVETRFISGGESLIPLVQDAAKEALESKSNNRCDAPRTTVTAYDVAPDAIRTTGVVLFATGGCSEDSKTRTGIAAQQLRWFIDGYCPQTFDTP